MNTAEIRYELTQAICTTGTVMSKDNTFTITGNTRFSDENKWKSVAAEILNKYFNNVEYEFIERVEDKIVVTTNPEFTMGNKNAKINITIREKIIKIKEIGGM